MVLVEGPRSIEAALRHGAEPLFALWDDASTSAGVADLLAASGADVVSVPPDTLHELAQTETPQGILAIAREPRSPMPDPREASRVLILDALQDPGNAGTLLRGAAAFGVGRVLALDGTVDLWNPKVIRASAGHAFGIPSNRIGWRETVDWLRRGELALLVGDAGGSDVRAWTDAVSESRWALVVGNEGAGPRAEALAEADVRLAIPMIGGVNSLNAAVAGSILLWALGPGRRRPGQDAP